MRRSVDPDFPELEIPWGTHAVGTADARLAQLDLSAEDEIALAEDLRERDGNRIRPGFYVGMDYVVPRDDEDDEDPDEGEPREDTEHQLLVALADEEALGDAA